MTAAFRPTRLRAVLVVSFVFALSACMGTEVLGEDEASNAGMGAGGGGTGATTDDALVPDDESQVDGSAGENGTCSNAPGVITVGLYQSCAVTDQGQLYCWGRAWPDEINTTPTRVLGLGMNGVVWVAQGAMHGCALKWPGTVWCWGRNDYGQIGDGTLEDRSEPTQVHGLIDVESIATGPFNSCALLGNDEVWCWGHGVYGHEDAGSGEDLLTPKRVWSRPEGASRVIAGYSHVCILDHHGDLHCAGRNAHGEVGDGTFEERLDFVKVDVSDIRDISAGTYYTCAIDQMGDAYCWGDNSFGQLGDGSDEPVQAAPVNVLLDVEVGSVHASADHTCAISRGNEVYCWGANTYGGLGYGGDPADQQSTPVLASLLSFSAAIAPGITTCAIDTRGLSCWGANDFGSVGDGSRHERLEPVSITGFCE